MCNFAYCSISYLSSTFNIHLLQNQIKMMGYCCSLPLQLGPPSSRHCLPHPYSYSSQLVSIRHYNHYNSTTTTNNRSKRCRQVLHCAATTHNPEEEDEEFQVLTAIQTTYNHIFILDTPKSRVLLLDSTHNVHSMLNKESKWTGSYWDEFAALPPLVPEGPVAIFGLGGGTAAHLILDLWPSLQLEGWEIDEILIDKARDYLGLRDLEKRTMDGGVLNVHIGDVFSPDAAIPGGYAGIIVDLFAEGKVLPQLQDPAIWLQLYDKLMPNGRLMVNCGAGEDGSSGADADGSSSWKLNGTIKALCEAFPEQVNWKKMPKSAGENYLALTGPLPDLTTWASALPDELILSVNQWQACNACHN